MSRHFLITAIRNIQKHKATTLLNIVGLAIGIAACILIIMWVRYEIEWDRFHQNIDDIYLVATLHDHGTDVSYGWGAPPAVAPALAAEYPEVIAATRSTSNRGYTIQYGDVIIDQHRGSRFVDPEYLTMFSFEFVSGDPETALDEVHSVVLTEKIAQQLFGDEDPLGKTVTVEYDYAFRVTGVVKEPPKNSTLRFESLAPIEFIRELSDRPDYIDTWYNCSFNHFVRIQPGTDIEAFNDKIAGRIKESRPSSNVTPFVYPFKKVNLYDVSGEGGFIETVLMISLIALLVLLIACINFMNMATAQAANRAREVGVRKVVGALRRELIRQFYFESMLQSVLATVLALALVEQLLPMFRELTGYPLFVNYTGDPVFWGSVLAITVVTGLISGSYPALVLSAFQPVTVLKGSLAAGVRGAWFRRGLVIVQFTVTTVLVINTYVVYQQFQHMQSMSVGYDRQSLVRLKMDDALQPRFETLKNRLLEHADILEVTKATHSLSGVYWNGVGWNWENKTTDENPLVTYMSVGDDWLETMGIEMADGQFYNPGTEFNEREVLINEAFAKLMGEESPVGKWLADNDDEPESYVIRGIVKDFHFKPVYRPVGPIMIFHNAGYPLWSVFARISGENVPETLAHIEKVYREMNPDRYMELGFVEEEYEGMYRFVRFRGEIFRNFAILAVVISCLGLFGLASYITEQRSKEIGIRKVLGASVSGIVALLTKEFVRWVIIANVIAWPLAFFLMRRWLEQFTYRVVLDFVPFLLATGVALMIAVVAVSFRAVQAALSNPVDAIRYE